MLFYTSEFCRCLDFWNPCASEISINHWSLQRLESWFAKYLDPNIWFHNLCLDIHSLYRKLSKCITCSTFSDFWWNVKWLLFTHSDTFQVEGKLHLYKYQLDWIIKRAINLNPTCVDKIMVMEACLHLSTSYLPRNLIRDFGILASREVKSGQRWPSTRLHAIHTAYILM